jgi:hypothetical protein
MRKDQDEDTVTGDGIRGIVLPFGALILFLGLLCTAITLLIYPYSLERDTMLLFFSMICIGLVLTLWGNASPHTRRGASKG